MRELVLDSATPYYHVNAPHPGPYTTATTNREYAATSLHVSFGPDPRDVAPRRIVLRYKVQWDEAVPSDGRAGPFAPRNTTHPLSHDCVAVHEGVACRSNASAAATLAFEGAYGALATRAAFEGELYNNTPYAALGEAVLGDPLPAGPAGRYNYTVTGLVPGRRYAPVRP